MEADVAGNGSVVPLRLERPLVVLVGGEAAEALEVTLIGSRALEQVRSLSEDSPDLLVVDGVEVDQVIGVNATSPVQPLPQVNLIRIESVALSIKIQDSLWPCESSVRGLSSGLLAPSSSRWRFRGAGRSQPCPPERR